MGTATADSPKGRKEEEQQRRVIDLVGPAVVSGVHTFHVELGCFQEVTRVTVLSPTERIPTRLFNNVKG
ncbi:hypothetical protein CRG98_003303 [Punica granatum]|uniref:Uncharacterized protein n=1 Tax=Punica granatum TaxID=22663 RepID=A0A2I0L6G8_PUNGR|nr:hypothetical protein CRG98_003303 [Punica granatum]